MTLTMRQGQEVVGMSVVTRDNGHEVGRVKDLIVHRAKNRVLGLLMARGGWFQHARVLPLSEVLSFGVNAILVPSDTVVVEAEQVPEIQVVLDQKKMLCGTVLMTANGNEIGRVKDVRFDEHSGKVEGFEVLSGIFVDATSDRVFLPADQNVNVREDVVLVSDEAAERLMQAASGVGCSDLTDEQTRELRSSTAMSEIDTVGTSAKGKVRTPWRPTGRRLRAGVQWAIERIGELWRETQHKPR
jgi:uncharacterized protein YrrD